MYTAAALCMWFLRAWKIGELEQLAGKKRKPPESLDPVVDEALELENGEAANLQRYKSNVLKRLYMWRIV